MILEGGYLSFWIEHRLRHDDGKHRMRTRTLRIHIRRGNGARLISLNHERFNVLRQNAIMYAQAKR